MDGKKSTLCRQYPGARHSPTTKFQLILNDRVKIGPLTEVEVFESAEALVLRSTTSFTTTRNSKSMNKYEQHVILTDTDHQISGAATSQQPLSCGRLRGLCKHNTSNTANPTYNGYDENNGYGKVL